MRRQVALKRQLQSLDRLGDAIGAMKSLSAHHVRSARDALVPAREYRAGIERAAVEAGVLFPSAGVEGEALIVLGAELGLCGPYNARIAEVAADRRREMSDGPTLCIGRRVASLLERRGVTATRVYSAPASVDGITDVLLSIAEDVLAAFLEEDLRAVFTIGARFQGVGAYEVTQDRLLPFEPPEVEATTARARYVSLEHLTEVALREMLYIKLHEELLEALASENGARLAATQRAQGWLDERRERMRRQLSSLRREASTQETVEIAAGARLHRDLKKTARRADV